MSVRLWDPSRDEYGSLRHSPDDRELTFAFVSVDLAWTLGECKHFQCEALSLLELCCDDFPHSNILEVAEEFKELIEIFAEMAPSYRQAQILLNEDEKLQQKVVDRWYRFGGDHRENYSLETAYGYCLAICDVARGVWRYVVGQIYGELISDCRVGLQSLQLVAEFTDKLSALEAGFKEIRTYADNHPGGDDRTIAAYAAKEFRAEIQAALDEATARKDRLDRIEEVKKAQKTAARGRQLVAKEKKRHKLEQPWHCCVSIAS